MLLKKINKTHFVSNFFSSNAQRLFANYKDQTKHDIIIVGAGCVGQGVAASFLQSNKNNRIFLIPSERSFKQIQHTGIKMKGAIDKNFFPSDQLIITNHLSRESLSKYNISKSPIIFSGTKSTDAVTSLKGIKDLLIENDPIIVCLQNGLGTENDIKMATSLFNCSVLKGHVFGALHQKEDAIFSYRGDLIIERKDYADAKLKSIFGEKDSSIFNLKLSNNILKSIYPKLTVNCVCNPLTVIFGKNLGYLRTYYEPLIKSICDELLQVANVLHIDLGASSNLLEIVLSTMEKYSEHHSSMYFDFLAGKKTEIDQINGAILRIGYENSIHTPLNFLMTNAIKKIEGLRSEASSEQEFYQRHRSYLEKIQNELLSSISLNNTMVKK